MGVKGFSRFILILLVILLFGAIGVIAYFYGTGMISLKGLNLPTSTETPLPTQTPAEISDIEGIKKAVYEKTGLNETNADVTVSKNTGTHATGGIKEKEAVGGAYFIAAKVNGKWICVYDGQSTPSCKQIEQYNFPKDMVPQCLNQSGGVVNR